LLHRQPPGNGEKPSIIASINGRQKVIRIDHVYIETVRRLAFNEVGCVLFKRDGVTLSFRCVRACLQKKKNHKVQQENLLHGT